ncbi:MAG: SRPBCC family protein [Hyphomicrobiaceae bacterium]
MRLTVETDIAAPPEIAFATAIDIERWPQFIRGISRIEILGDGRIRLGASFRETRIMFGREAVEQMTISELAPPRAFVLTADNHGTHFRAEHIFESVSGGTRLRLDFHGQPQTWLARLTYPLGLMMSRHVRKQLQIDLDDVKREAERRAALLA